MVEAVEETIEQQPAAEETPLSLREQIISARDEAIEKEADPAEKPQRVRDENGKFVKAAEVKEPKEPKTKEKPEKVSNETKTQAPLEEKPVTPEIEMPKSFNPALQGKWKELPKEVQAELAKREKDTSFALAKQDEDRLLGKELKEVISPYMPIIRAEGGTPAKAVQELMNTAYLLRTASPQQKGQLLWQVARQFGADMSQTTQQAQAQPDPRFHQLSQELQGLKSAIEQERTAKKQQEDAELQRQIGAFSADPAHPHFETVKAHMGTLLQSGLAKDLQDAYEQAVYANPQTRSTLLEQQNAAGEEQRVAERKARAEAARKAGSSLKGAPGMGASKNGKIVQPDLRSELKAAFAAHREG